MKKILKILCTFCLLLWITLLLFTLLLSSRINSFSHAILLHGCLLNRNFACCNEARSKHCVGVPHMVKQREGHGAGSKNFEEASMTAAAG